MRAASNATLEYIDACELGSAVSISFVWVEADGERTPAIEVHMDGGSGPDIIRRLGLNLAGGLRGVNILRVIQFSEELQAGAKKMMAQMQEPKEANDS